MQITRKTRKDIIDQLRINGILWSGGFNDVEFLSRLYNLEEMPSNDSRFKNASGDIQKHRILNDDWDNDWVFYDPRFNIINVEDEKFLGFLVETINPIVRIDNAEQEQLLKIYNDELQIDGWELYKTEMVTGKSIFSYRRLLNGTSNMLSQAKIIQEPLNSVYIDQQIKRMQSSIDDDPEAAIGTAKEFLESICKTILEDFDGTTTKDEDFPKLVRLTLKKLELTPENFPENDKASERIRILLNNLASISNSLAEIRNNYGSGHGKIARTEGLEPRHARLAIGAASTAAIFIFETYQKMKSKDIH
jgi:hypothetical protein